MASGLSIKTLFDSLILHRLLVACLFFSRTTSLQQTPETEDHSVLCRNCGKEIGEPEGILNSHLSPFDSRRQNLTRIFGKENVPIQTLENPNGIKFDCILFRKAGCVAYHKLAWNTEATWFPGYAWRVCVCSQCGQHLGWMFEPEDTVTDDLSKPSDLGFYALILDKLIDESYASSLVSGGMLS